VYSSKIEGEEIELDSFIKHKRFNIAFKPDYTQKIDDIYDAYQFAKANNCSKVNICNVHQHITKNILPLAKEGVIRKDNMYVISKDGNIEYVAALPAIVNSEMQKFYADLETLITVNLNVSEVFYYAAILHLVFLKIHPFNDGNGRTARLVEKRLLAEKLGAKAWLIQSEKYYYDNQNAYYNNIRKLGLEYESLKYENALPFIEMLALGLNEK
jgi:Fic family protein